jgi:malonate transporter
VLFKFHLPLLIRLPLQVIGNTTGGVALFTLGVLLSALKFQMNLATGIVIFLKNIAMPGIALGLGLLFHLDGILIKGAVIATACPSATLGAIFSATFKVGQKTIPTEVLASNLFGVLSMVFWVYVVEKI